jgi:hypothetical protein
MPWKQTDPMTERAKLITEHLSGDYNVSDLARHHRLLAKPRIRSASFTASAPLLIT